MHRINTQKEVHPVTNTIFFEIHPSGVILTHNSLKMFVEGIFVTGTLNVKNLAASLVALNYPSNIDHVTEIGFYGDLLNTDEV